ncbi:MAG: glycosyl hydrolase, partial [Longicatena sp.]
MKSFVDEFKNPTNRYGATPFWFLNGDLTEEELKWQIKDMKEKGLGGYVMHSRYGRRLPYFSEDFFDRIGTIVDESEKLGMNAIVYDEDDWPSGMSGTKVIDDHPEFKHKQMELVYLDVTGKSNLEYTPDKGVIYKAYACKFSKKSDKKEECIVSESKDITPTENVINVSFDGEAYDSVVVFLFQEVSGYTIYTTYPKNKGFRAQPDTWNWYFPFGEYVDLLNKDAVAYFIETTCEEYKKRYGEHFGKAIKYFFTDEPGFYTVMRGNDSAVAWSDVFAETFKERKGYDIKDNILALAYETGGKTKRVRYDYYDHLTHLFEHNFVKQYSDWCTSNGIKLTGHYRLCYPQLVWQRNYAGNVMSMFRQMGAPGTDRLDTPGMNDTFATKDWSWQIEDKLCSSIGHQYNIERRMTESFACSGWEYRFADMKRVTDWQYMMGMNMMVPHAFHYSISGQRKKECIPSFFYQNPTWQNYNKYSEYLCRLGEMLIGGEHIADIVILNPMTTIWADDIP